MSKSIKFINYLSPSANNLGITFENIGNFEAILRRQKKYLTKQQQEQQHKTLYDGKWTLKSTEIKNRSQRN